MPTYIALLRGINMAGHKVIKMDKLRSCFESIKFKNVCTYIQSGNVLFDSRASDIDKLTLLIEKGLMKSFGYDIRVFVRTIVELEKVAKIDPFKSISTHSDSKKFVTFLTTPPKPKPKTPLWSKRKDVEVLMVGAKEFFSISHEIKGRYGSPNLFVEKHFNLPATTRNWRTIKKLIELTVE